MYSLIAFAYMPVFLIGFLLFGKRMRETQMVKTEAIKGLGSHTEETLSALKLVVSFNRENLACKEFDAIADKTKTKAIAAANSMAFLQGFFMCAAFGFFCYSYYIGSRLIEDNRVEPGSNKKIDI
jgi:ABC-type multidrug transport system fused ATPase/permease subunit